MEKFTNMESTTNNTTPKNQQINNKYNNCNAPIKLSYDKNKKKIEGLQISFLPFF